MHRVITDYARYDDTDSNVKVFIRARPPETPIEISDFICSVPLGPDEYKKINISSPDQSHKKYGEISFQFDKVFWTNSTQQELFDTVCKPLADQVLKGM